MAPDLAVLAAELGEVSDIEIVRALKEMALEY
jgi:hypothetical protein